MVILKSIAAAYILAGVALTSPIQSKAIENTFTIQRFSPPAFQAISQDVPSPHVFPLTRHVGSHKASFMRSLRAGNQVDGTYKHDKLRSGQTPLSAKDAGQ